MNDVGLVLVVWVNVVTTCHTFVLLVGFKLFCELDDGLNRTEILSENVLFGFKVKEVLWIGISKGINALIGVSNHVDSEVQQLF